MIVCAWGSEGSMHMGAVEKKHGGWWRAVIQPQHLDPNRSVTLIVVALMDGDVVIAEERINCLLTMGQRAQFFGRGSRFR